MKVLFWIVRVCFVMAMAHTSVVSQSVPIAFATAFVAFALGNEFQIRLREYCESE